MAQTTCGFCESNTQISNEHIFAEWVGVLLGADQGKSKTVVHGLKRESYQPRKWRASTFDHKVRMACTTCNSGWMAGLETAVAPIITPMIRGVPGALKHSDRLTIARWAVKTAMVQEYAHPGRHYFTQAERRSLMNDGVNSELGARVWAGRYVTRPNGLHGLSVRLVGVDGALGACVSMFSLGQFAVQVLVERASARQEERQPWHAGPWEELLSSIWPPAKPADIRAVDLTWPPSVSITSEEMFYEVFCRFASVSPKHPFGGRNGG